jgi:16S rRNA (uracil1498-N3)-methyltransferase
MSIRPDQPLFYLSTLPDSGGEARLDVDESRHVLASRRKVVGDVLYLTDGAGGLARCRIADVWRRRQIVVAIEAVEYAGVPSRQLHVAVAPPKGDRQTVMLDMLTQLGMTEFTPLSCDYSQARITEKTLQRWRRVCLAACKQARRVWLPQIHRPCTIGELLQSAHGMPTLVAQPGGRPLQEILSNVSPEQAKRLVMLTGPEGGFSGAEQALFAEAGVMPVTLGEHILRVETAAVALLSATNIKTFDH